LVIYGERRKIKDIVQELIQNAIKFTPDGGKIVVSVRRDNDFCVISVKDNGIGIDPAEHGKIFEKFYEVQDSRYHSTSKSGFMGGGLGLGLSSVRAMAIAHGGGVKVKSEKEKGSEFLIYLPLASAKEPVASIG
jgi:signal transduction histidine kinase